MKLYVKQKVLSLKEDFDVYDRQKKPVYHVKSKWFSIGRSMKIIDVKSGKPLVSVKQQLLSIFPILKVYYEGRYLCSVKKTWSLFRPKYQISRLNWRLQGDLWQHDYRLKDRKGNDLAKIHKQFLAWSDTFEMTILNQELDPVIVVAVILAIDMVMDNDSLKNSK